MGSRVLGYFAEIFGSAVGGAVIEMLLNPVETSAYADKEYQFGVDNVAFNEQVPTEKVCAYAFGSGFASTNLKKKLEYKVTLALTERENSEEADKSGNTAPIVK